MRQPSPQTALPEGATYSGSYCRERYAYNSAPSSGARNYPRHVFPVGGGILADFGREKERGSRTIASPRPLPQLQAQDKIFPCSTVPSSLGTLMGVGGALPAVQKNANLLPPLCSPDQARLVRVYVSFGFMKHRSQGCLRQCTCHARKVFPPGRNRSSFFLQSDIAQTSLKSLPGQMLS